MKTVKRLYGSVLRIEALLQQILAELQNRP
jgi:hypothetical protein